jgi:hypothetical protein
VKALGVGSFILVDALSCPSIGECVLGGQYLDRHGEDQALLADEKNGRWQAAREAPGTAKLNASGQGSIESVSCPSPGNCGATGSYGDRPDHTQLFVLDETSGRWGTAKELPGLARLNTGGHAIDGEISCPSAGNCVTDGDYTDNKSLQAVVATEKNGRWGRAEKVPGTAKLNVGGAALTVSCSRSGNCGIGGLSLGKSGTEQAFVANVVNGHWRLAREVPGSGTLNKDGNAAILTMSCTSTTACTAGGSYTDSKGRLEAMVATETG